MNQSLTEKLRTLTNEQILDSLSSVGVDIQQSFEQFGLIEENKITTLEKIIQDIRRRKIIRNLKQNNE